jgi:thioredoxin reductase (NADPH)
MTRPLKNMCEVAVIGGGLAGLAAARHAARLGRLVTLFEGTGLYGGLVATIGEVEDLPFPGEFAGQDLAIPLLEDARKVGVQVVEWPVDSVTVSAGGGEKLTLTDGSGKVWKPDAIIVASGGALRKLDVPGEEEFLGRGVSRCATCDGGFYIGKDVAVIGSGDGAVHEAITLSKVVRTVYVVTRSPLKAKREHIDKLAGRENVRFVWDAQVSAVVGEGSVTGLALRDVRNGTQSHIAVSGVFPFIGVEPATGFLPAGLLAPGGQVRAGGDYASGDARVFAAGAAREGFGGTAVQAMAEGVGAAEAAARMLAKTRIG